MNIRGAWDSFIKCVFNNKRITFLSVTLFAFIISTMVLAIQRNNLQVDYDRCRANCRFSTSSSTSSTSTTMSTDTSTPYYSDYTSSTATPDDEKDTTDITSTDAETTSSIYEDKSTTAVYPEDIISTTTDQVLDNTENIIDDDAIDNVTDDPSKEKKADFLASSIYNRRSRSLKKYDENNDKPIDVHRLMRRIGVFRGI